MNALQDIIERSHKSTRQIAENIGCTHMTIYNWMKNPRSMKAADIVLLARELRKSPRNLFSLIINN